MIKQLIILISILIFLSATVIAQTPNSTPKSIKKSGNISGKTSPKTAKSPTSGAQNEKDELDKALAITDLTEKIKALLKFTTNYPASAEKVRVLEKIVSLRAQLADEKLGFSDTAAGIQLFKQAVYDVPIPISDSLFADVVLQFPTNLFYRGQQAAAIEVAKLIEEKVSDNPKQLLGLATFYLGTEKAGEGKRLAQRAIELNEKLGVEASQKVAAYQTLGLANRLSFQLEESEKAYTKALELNPDSAVSKRSLAEMKRALGKSDESLTLYRELTEKDAADISSQNGLILSLFDAGKQAEAEIALNKSLEINPNNLFLLVGAAYWYAGQKNSEKAVDYAQKAIAIEPRYTWAHIALARGLLLQKRPLDAEKTLLIARQYGKFPTLSYELATARLSAGFFEEAGNEVWKNFVVKDGLISTLNGSNQKEGKDFIEFLDLERRSSIFESATADTPENAARIKSLLVFYQLLASKESTDEQLNQAVDEFIKGDDNMRTHRQLYAANQLLIEKKNLSRILELLQDATKGVDSSLDVMNPAAAVLADELLESRVLAISRNEMIVVPDVPRQTLSNILRGRIEEISGWALFQQGKMPEAIVRLKRAISILPEKSAWWRTSLWQIGLVYDSNGNSKEALNSYVKSYTNSAPDAIRWSTIEAVYRKVNGNTTDLEKLIGTKPYIAETVSQVSVTPTPTPSITPSVESKPEVSPTPKETPAPTPTPKEIIKTKIPSETKTEISTPDIVPIATPEIKPTPDSIPEVKNEPTPTPTVKPVPISTPKVKTDAPKTEKTIDAPKENTSSKPLFEPIIITVPKSDAVKPANKETVENKEANKTEKPNEKPTEKPTENSDKPSDETTSAISRPRVAKDKPAEPDTTELTSCLIASQDSISILNQGGNLGILIGYNDEGDISKIKAESSKPDDISVSLEPDIGKQSNRAFFIIKSISPNKGIFTVTFTSPCGKKEILVKVR